MLCASDTGTIPAWLSNTNGATIDGNITTTFIIKTSNTCAADSTFFRDFAYTNVPILNNDICFSRSTDTCSNVPVAAYIRFPSPLMINVPLST